MMIRKALDTSLLLATLVGVVLAWQSGREQGRLQVRLDRLARAAGDFPIYDPSQVHVLALETGEPLHFAWRVYLPANYHLVRRANKSGFGGSSTSTTPEEFIARVRFREDRDGRLELYQLLVDGSSRGGFGDKALAKVLHGRFDKVLVEQLGTPDLATIGPDEPLVLLRLKLPADMQAEIVKIKEMTPSERANFNPEFFDMSFGPDEKKPPSPDSGK